jgi:hypothetical protein
VPIEITDRYKLIFEEHHYASDFRVKIIQGWCLFYGAFAAGFGWTQANEGSKPVGWILSAFAIVITLFMWTADFRHRKALAHSKRIGKAIEEAEEAAIPADQRFFASIASGRLTHSLGIDVLTGLMLGVLLRVSTWLRATQGTLTSLPPHLIWWAVGGSALGFGFHVFVEFWLHRADGYL